MSSARAALLLILLGILFCRQPARAEGDYDQEKCSLCHIRESVFFDPAFAGPGRIKEFGEERMCMSCHNGSVRDSRDVLWRGAQHPAPVGKAATPCSACHSPHAKGGWGVLAGTSVSLGRGGDALCTGCHRGYLSKGGGLHGESAMAGGCGECHRAHGGVGKELLREGKSALCMRCHAKMKMDRAGGHPVAAARGAGREGGGKNGNGFPECTACHPVHGGEGASRVASSRCAACHSRHAGDAAGGARTHKGQKDCLSCHVFHANRTEDGKGFRGRDILPAVLCGGCHPPFRSDTMKKGRETGTHVTQGAGNEDLCLRCHRIHGAAPGTPLLASGKPYFCLECHGEQNTINEAGSVTLAHPVFERVPKGRLDAAVKEKRLATGPMGEITCGTCHSVHKAARGTPLLASGSAGNESCFWCHPEMRGKNHVSGADPAATVGCGKCHPVHGRHAEGGNPWKSVCEGCHPRSASHTLEKGGKSVKPPKGMPVFDSRGRKTAIGAMSCPTCHEPHGTMTGTRRLKKTYASTGYLCTACHRDEESVALTPHDLRGILGNSICEPCHLPHGGGSPWMWGLAKGAGGQGEDACRSCHGEKGIGSPVPAGGHPSNIVVARPLPEDFPLIGLGAESGGRGGIFSCPACHAVHGTGRLPAGVQGAGKLLRWPSGLDPSGLQASRSCLPCHAGKTTPHAKDAECAACHPPHDKENGGEACLACHERSDKGTAARHAAAGKSCRSCHRLHGKEREPVESSCLVCHKAKESVIGTPHGSYSSGGACGPCHPPHDEPEKVTLKRHAWEDEVIPADMACLRCHRDGGGGGTPRFMEHPKTRKPVPTSYGATVVLEAPVIIVGRNEGGKLSYPLFDEKGGRGLSGRAGCLTCHDPHAGRMDPKGSAREAAGYQKDPSAVFLAAICAPCHRGDAEKHVRQFHVLPRKTE